MDKVEVVLSIHEMRILLDSKYEAGRKSAEYRQLGSEETLVL